MIIQPKIRGFICTTAHPAGCKRSVEEQIKYVVSHGAMHGPKRVLIIGASTGYGLASRIVTAFGMRSETIGVFYERAAENKRTASPGWYNTAAFEEFAHADSLYAKSINGDAFSQDVKLRTANLIRQDWGQVDCVIYSLAAPRRQDPRTQEIYSSVLKPIGAAYTGKNVDAFTGDVHDVTLTPASADEIDNTIAVMGGDDWALWIDYLREQNLLADGVITLAYSYIGPELTYPIYKNGTIGRAKEDLKQTSDKLNASLKTLNGHARIAINKALVTQASAAIPVVPLYISLLYKLMKEKGSHEGCIEQMYRLFHDHQASMTDNQPNNLIRLDDYEMSDDIQQKIREIWPKLCSENVDEYTDIQSYRQEFYRLFGFNWQDIDLQQDVNPDVKIPSIIDNMAHDA